MKTYDDIRVLLNINLVNHEYHYSDRDGEAHKFTTSYDGRVLVEDDVIMYKGAITNVSDISESIDVYRNSQSVGNVKVTLTNFDNIQVSSEYERVALESAKAELFIVRGDMYDEVIGSYYGIIDNVSYDESTISFDIVSEEITIFKNIPESLLNEDTFQTKLVIKNPHLECGAITLRFGNWNHIGDIVKKFVMRVKHKAFDGHSVNYWKCARVDVVDASGILADPENERFCIGEFAIVAASIGDELYLPMVCDRYFLYTFIDSHLRTGAGAVSSAPYEMSNLINNTMMNSAFVAGNPVENGTFDADGYWTKGTGWLVDDGDSNVASKTAGTASNLSQDIGAVEGVKYIVEVEMTSFTAGTLLVKVGGASATSTMVATGVYRFEVEAGVVVGHEGLLEFYGDSAFIGSIDNVRVSTEGLTLQLIKNPIPENADSVGRPFPIIYGRVEKVLSVWSMSAKSTRQNSISAGDDVYVIAGHRIASRHASQMRVYFGLDENATGMRVPPGVFDYVPNPLPKSIYEIDHWLESGYSLVAQPEQVVDGDFPNADNWVGAGVDGWVIAAGYATKTAGVTASLSQDIGAQVGIEYTVKFTVNRTAGTVIVKVGGESAGSSVNASGVYIFKIVAGDYNTDIEIYADSSFAGDIDDVSAIIDCSYKNICPLHKLVEITTNEGELVTAIKLRGDEYTGWTENERGDTTGNLPGVNGQPQFPIRYGLANSKVYVSFDGMMDEDASITGVKDGLIEHPVDIIKHFLLNYTNFNKRIDKIDEESFAFAKSRLQNWKFAVAITSVTSGKDIIDRICKQCKCTWQWENNKFYLNVFDLSYKVPEFFIDSEAHFKGEPKWSRKTVREMYNDFTFKYGYNQVTNAYDNVTKRSKKNDQYCRDAYAAYGEIVRSLEEVTLPDVRDSFTVSKIAEQYVDLNARPRDTLVVPIRIDDETYGIKPGKVVSINYRYPKTISYGGSTYNAGDYREKIYLTLATSTKKDNTINCTFFELL